jgi:hypothetical protein
MCLSSRLLTESNPNSPPPSPTPCL